MINYKIQSNGFTVKDIDEKNMQVKVGISTVGFKDSDGDVIVKSAFDKTIQERGPMAKDRIRHLMHHDVDKVVGRPKEFGWDGDTLYAVSKLSNSQMGRDAIEDYKLNLYEHSIGFEALQENFNSQEGYNVITELRLWEYSSVTWGANEKTPFMGFVKGLNKEEQVQKVGERMDKLIKAVRKGNYSDDRFTLLEFELKQIQSFYDSLIKGEPSNHSVINEPNEEDLINILKSKTVY